MCLSKRSREVPKARDARVGDVIWVLWERASGEVQSEALSLSRRSHAAIHSSFRGVPSFFLPLSTASFILPFFPLPPPPASSSLPLSLSPIFLVRSRKSQMILNAELPAILSFDTWFHYLSLKRFKLDYAGSEVRNRPEGHTVASHVFAICF